jgi:hypothetical protein
MPSSLFGEDFLSAPIHSPLSGCPIGPSDAKRKTKRKLNVTQKAIKDRILITCSPAKAPEKGAC